MHLNIPDYVWNVLGAMPDNTHPMTMFNTGILAMQGDSVFRKRYDEECKSQNIGRQSLKTEFGY